MAAAAACFSFPFLVSCLKSECVQLADDLKQANASEMRNILARECDPNLANSDGYTLLDLCVWKRDRAGAQFLIDNGAKVNNDSVNGPPLHTAIRRHDLEMVKFLLANGADVNKKDRQGMPPILLACIESQIEIIKLFLRKGVDVDSTEQHGRTSLIYAARFGNYDLVKILLEHGADPRKMGINNTYSAMDAATRQDIKDLLQSYTK